MTSAPKRRWFQFSMRELLLLIATIACALGWARERKIHSGYWPDDQPVAEVIERMNLTGEKEIQVMSVAGGGKRVV
jgi:hypothetical protein